MFDVTFAVVLVLVTVETAFSTGFLRHLSAHLSFPHFTTVISNLIEYLVAVRCTWRMECAVWGILFNCEIKGLEKIIFISNLSLKFYFIKKASRQMTNDAKNNIISQF